MANIVVNSSDVLQFVEGSTRPTDETPTVIFQAGEWELDSGIGAGIVVDVQGAQAPLLSAENARKLSKWLLKAADLLDGTKDNSRKKHRANYDDDADDEFIRHR